MDYAHAVIIILPRPIYLNNFVVCYHSRSHEYFLESINSSRFLGVMPLPSGERARAIFCRFKIVSAGKWGR